MQSKDIKYVFLFQCKQLTLQWIALQYRSFFIVEYFALQFILNYTIDIRQINYDHGQQICHQLENRQFNYNATKSFDLGCFSYLYISKQKWLKYNDYIPSSKLFENSPQIPTTSCLVSLITVVSMMDFIKETLNQSDVVRTLPPRLACQCRHHIHLRTQSLRYQPHHHSRSAPLIFEWNSAVKC